MRISIITVFLNCIIISTQLDSISGWDDESPLFLSPFIESGEIAKGRKLAEVNPFFGNIKSYSGFFTVEEQYNSNLFFWYFPSKINEKNAPLLVWLNGWGTASTYGIFLQTGPYDLSTRVLNSRETSWQKYYHVVYIDSPVGTGYSFTNSTKGYSTNLDKLTLNLQRALEQFFKLFPELDGRELYLTSLSLGGKYIPSLAHRLYKLDSFNLKGIFLGNPLLDLGRQLTYENYLYELGFIDKNQRFDLIKKQNAMKFLLRVNNYDKFNKEVYDFLLADKSYLVNITGLNNIYDYEDNVIDTKYYMDFIQRYNIRKALHVGSVEYGDGLEAMRLFGQGMAFSVTGYLEKLINNIKIMIYSGQNDVCVTYPNLIDVLFSLNWYGRIDYMKSERERLYEDDGLHVWGYLRNYGPLTDVLIRKAGHSAVSSQPEKVLWLLKNFTDYKRFN